MVRYFLLAFGLSVLGLLIWHIGPANIYEAAARLGPSTLVVMLFPSFLMYVVEAYGWRVVLGPAGRGVPFWRLLAIRMAGEVVNMTTPTAYLGGEPLKAYLLKQYHVPMEEGGASVVIAKTTMTIAEVCYILLGMALGFILLGAGSSVGYTVTAALFSVGVLVCSIGAFIMVQRRGLFASMLAVAKALRLRVAFLESQEERLRAIDRTILQFYHHRQGAFYASIGVYFLGWMAESLEVFVILHYLGGPTTVLSAFSIGALAVFIKGGSFFIPGSLGAQDGGNVLLLKTFGYSEVTGLTFALLRRFRELVWIGIGLLCLAMMGKKTIQRELNEMGSRW
ncbi:MAG: flippase-like domain-containing protein [Nitrospira sp.]|nr:flippase-like domain-containing protein [Nitrospira sp.]MCP9464301.1 flippase-like domain-containing protein [Nitrospira sp.]